MRKVTIDKLDKIAWRILSENAHFVAFGEKRPSAWDRIDFALVIKNHEKLIGYVTCRELDALTLYWQYGGAFPGAKGTSLSWSGYQELLNWCKSNYDRVGTLIENNNKVMLKMAAKIGFKIVGIRNFKNSVLLEHLIEFKEVN